VTILGSETIHTAQGPVEYYKIVPINEYRYIPAAAVRRGADPAAAARPGGSAIPPEWAAKVQAAEEAYRRGEATGDWSEALRLYQELQQSPNHEVRLTAWNRIEFIKQKLAQGGSPIVPAGFRDNIGPGGTSRSTPRSSYTYAPDDGRSFPSAPPAAPGSWQGAPSARPPSTPNQSQYAPSTAKAAPSTPTVMVGRLVRSSKTDINGKPLYALLDSQNQLKCYVSGMNLERFLEQNVIVEGDGLIYHAYLRDNVLRATDVKLMH
jgi:hypothetical protein